MCYHEQVNSSSEWIASNIKRQVRQINVNCWLDAELSTKKLLEGMENWGKHAWKDERGNWHYKN